MYITCGIVHIWCDVLAVSYVCVGKILSIYQILNSAVIKSIN